MEWEWEERRTASSQVFRGRVISLRVDTVELPDGRTATREVVDHPGAVVLAALTAARELLLVRQYRYAIGQATLEVPAGTLHPGEEPQACAARELREETGYEAGRLTLLQRFYSTPGFTTERMFLYLAEDLRPGPPSPDEDEYLRVEAVPLPRALRMAEQGEILDAKSLVAVFALARRSGL